MSSNNELTNREIYGVYEQVMGSPVDKLDYRNVRHFARAVLAASDEKKQGQTPSFAGVEVWLDGKSITYHVAKRPIDIAIGVENILMLACQSAVTAIEGATNG